MRQTLEQLKSGGQTDGEARRLISTAVTALFQLPGKAMPTVTMLLTAVIIWVVGLFTIVPFGTYYLLFHASREQYAALITLVLFWIFGYWGVVGPLLAALKVRAVFRAIERAQTRGDLVQTLQSPEARDVAIDFIASENHIPRFAAAWVYRLLVKVLKARARKPGAAELAEGKTQKRL